MNIKDYGYDGIKQDKDNILVARIITTYKDRYEVVSNKGVFYAKLKKSRFYNEDVEFPTIGDFVLVEYVTTGDSLICLVLPRKTAFYRAASIADRNHKLHKSHRQLVAANFDYVCIMQSLNNNFNVRRIERYLSMAYESHATAIIILTKSDLVENVNDYIYEVESVAIGVDVYAVSAKTGYGIDKLSKYFTAGKTIVFLGSSGVGKSTLVNKILGQEVMKTSNIRSTDSRGRHTTTNKKLIYLPNGSMVIDTPGMRELGMWDSDSGINKTFDEIESLTHLCKYKDCTHKTEPGCMIRQKIEEGSLSIARYNAYLKLKDETKYNTDSESYLKLKKEKFKKISNINKKR